jgi:hypothetical protein
VNIASDKLAASRMHKCWQYGKAIKTKTQALDGRLCLSKVRSVGKVSCMHSLSTSQLAHGCAKQSVCCMMT